MLKFIVKLCFVLIFVFLFSYCSNDENNCNQNGGVNVTIRDGNGMLLQDVKVTVDGVKSVYTNSNGLVEFSDLDIGLYQVILEKNGYESSSNPQENKITIVCNEVIDSEFRMKISGPILAVSNEELNFGTNENVISFDIYNAGIGQFNWEIKDIPHWIEIPTDQTSGLVSNGVNPVEVKILRESLPLGEHEETFTVRADNVGSFQIKVFVTVVSPINVIPPEIDFGTNSTSESFDIVLNSPSEVNYSISTPDSWITVFPSTGILNVSLQLSTITVSIDREQLNFGHHQGSINVFGNGYNRKVTVYVEKVDPNAPKLVVSHEIIDFGVGLNQVQLTLSNTGVQDLEIYDISSDVNWLTFNDSNIPNISTNNGGWNLLLTVQRDALSQGEFGGNLTINSNGGNKTIPVYVEKDSENIVLELGKIAHYTFNGNADDSSDFGNAGAVNGASLAEDRNGNYNACYYFDGIDDYIGVPNQLTKGTNQYTIAFWMNNYSYGSETKYIFSLRGPSVMDIYVTNENGTNYLNWRALFRCNGFITYDNIVTTTDDFPIGEWSHVVCVYNNIINSTNYIELYVNAELQDRSTVENPFCIVEDYDLNTSLGAYNQSSGNWNGYLDDLRIYERALNLDEIELLYCLENYSSDCN